MTRNATTAHLNSTTSLMTIKPTELERRLGRLLRGPDGHGEGEGAGSGGEGQGAADGASGAGEGAGADGASGDGAGDDGSLMGNASQGDGEGQGEGDGAGDGDGDDANLTDEQKAEKARLDAEAEDKVPEGDYELATIKLGEGDDAAEFAVDTAMLTELTPELKAAGLGTKAVQKLSETVVPKLYERFSQQQQDAFAETRADWAKQTKADPEVGGKNFDKAQSDVARALDHFMGPAETKDKDGNVVKNEFRVFLNETGLGNHPTMFKAFAKVGAALSEDGILARGAGGGGEAKLSREEILYPEDAPKKKQ